MTRLATLPPLMSEKAFMSAVLDLAKLTHWRCYHTFDARRSEAGFPDICMTRDGRILFAELKTERGRVTEAQREWLEALASCPGAEVHVWRPADWDDVERTLRRRP